jgi:UDP-glucose 4-epimerase
MKLLIPGGAGYIGSHMVRYAQEHGHEVVVLDDFSAGHEWALEYMQENKRFSAFNLCNGDGFSVLQVIKGCEYIANNEIHYRVDGRRDGDPAVLVADNELGLRELNWNPEYSDINDIIKSAWSWRNSEKC